MQVGGQVGRLAGRFAGRLVDVQFAMLEAVILLYSLIIVMGINRTIQKINVILCRKI